MELCFLVLSQPGGQQGAAEKSWKLSHHPTLIDHSLIRISNIFLSLVDPSEGFPPESQISQMQNNAEYFYSFLLNP